MGFFSWKCAKTGLPLMAPYGGYQSSPDRPNESEAVILGAKSNGLTRLFGRGEYDGYGRFAGYDGGYEDIEAERVRMVLAAFYAPEEDRWDDLPPNESDPGQGYFHDGKFVERAFSQAAHAWAERVAPPGEHGRKPRFYVPLATQWFYKVDDLREQLRNDALMEVAYAISPGWRDLLGPVIANRRQGIRPPPREWGTPIPAVERAMGAIHRALHCMDDVDRGLMSGSTDALRESVPRILKSFQSALGFDKPNGADPGAQADAVVPAPGWTQPPFAILAGLERMDEVIRAMAIDAAFDHWEKASTEAVAASGHDRWTQLPLTHMPEWVKSAPSMDIGHLIVGFEHQIDAACDAPVDEGGSSAAAALAERQRA